MTRLEPKDNECAICFALKHGEIEVDERKSVYYVCDKHLALSKKIDKEIGKCSPKG